MMQSLRVASVRVRGGLVGMGLLLSGCTPEVGRAAGEAPGPGVDDWIVLPSRVELGRKGAGDWAEAHIAIMNHGAASLTVSAVELDCSCAEQDILVVDVDAPKILTFPHTLAKGRIEAWRLRFRIPDNRDRVRLRFYSSTSTEERFIEVLWDREPTLQVMVGAVLVDFVDFGGFQEEEPEVTVSVRLDSGEPFHVASWSASHPGIHLEEIGRAEATQKKWVLRVVRQGLPRGLFSGSIRVQLSGGGSGVLQLRGIVPPR